MQSFTLCKETAFVSEAEARTAWFTHRRELIEMVKDELDWTSCTPDWRPWAWFAFKAGFPR